MRAKNTCLPVILVVLYSFLPVTRAGAISSPDEALAYKIFPLLAGIKADRVVRESIKTDKVLHAIGENYQRRVAAGLDTCQSAISLARVMQWTRLEMEEVCGRLTALPEGSAFMRNLENNNACIAYAIPRNKELLQKAWTDAAHGMNRIYDVYIAGTKPAYAAIDSVLTDFRSPQGFKNLTDTLKYLLRSVDHRSSFYAVPVALAVKALLLSRRDEAIRYEPITAGINAEAYTRVKQVSFSSYPYSAILTPGYGPEEKGVRIDHRSMARCQMAVEQFRKKQAPFIIVSGGHVYPAGTPFSEGVEMRRYLIEQYGIPASAIITEPYARHTTTNVRNASRLVYLFGLPDSKPVLVTTDSVQTQMVVNQQARCRRELGYVPFRDAGQISKTTSFFYPVKEAFQINVFDPLDP